ncbi:hypothetical protein BDP67DRAFT_83740 [Colletotrichum lupini]|nr:hypothetical protein BDP67DRAFT_83740 [Colletotrichum lupini]
MSRGHSGLLGRLSAAGGHASCVAHQRRRLPCRCLCISNRAAELFVASARQRNCHPVVVFSLHTLKSKKKRRKRTIQSCCKCKSRTSTTIHHKSSKKAYMTSSNGHLLVSRVA